MASSCDLGALKLPVCDRRLLVSFGLLCWCLFGFAHTHHIGKQVCLFACTGVDTPIHTVDCSTDGTSLLQGNIVQMHGG